MKAHDWVLVEVEVLDAQVGDFLHAGAGVIEEQDQRVITERQASFGWHAMQQRLDLVAFEKAGFGWRDALDRDRGDLLADASISGERVAMYSNRLWIAASRWLRVLMWLPRSSSRWRRNARIRSRVRSSSDRRRDLAALLDGEEHEQEPDRVAVAAYRLRGAGP